MKQMDMQMRDGTTESFPPRELTVCFTGHRKLSEDARRRVIPALNQAICDAYAHGVRWFLSGGAMGFDTLAAIQVLNLQRTRCPEAKLCLVTPCADQALYWNDQSRYVRSKLLRQADAQVTLSDKYFLGCMQNRNRFMVNHSSRCIALLINEGPGGGTRYTVEYAIKKLVPVTFLLSEPKGLQTSMFKEKSCSSTSTSPSVFENAATAILPPLPDKPTGWKDTSIVFSVKQR